MVSIHSITVPQIFKSCSICTFNDVTLKKGTTSITGIIVT